MESLFVKILLILLSGAIAFGIAIFTKYAPAKLSDDTKTKLRYVYPFNFIIVVTFLFGSYMIFKHPTSPYGLFALSVGLTCAVFAALMDISTFSTNRQYEMNKSLVEDINRVQKRIDRLFASGTKIAQDSEDDKPADTNSPSENQQPTPKD